jgi:nucleotide-binding universal stress UspA family protein
MSTSRTGRVLVATSGSAASQSAIAFAAHAAAARGLTLEIVHVVPPTVAVGPYGLDPDLVVRQAGREVLGHGRVLALRAEPDVDVTTTLPVGSRPEAIVDTGREADLIVVGGHPHDLMERLWTGSTVSGVAARATCPVAVVPSDHVEPESHQVVVGLKSTEHVGELLRAAFSSQTRPGRSFGSSTHGDFCRRTRTRLPSDSPLPSGRSSRVGRSRHSSSTCDWHTRTSGCASTWCMVSPGTSWSRRLERPTSW